MMNHLKNIYSEVWGKWGYFYQEIMKHYTSRVKRYYISKITSLKFGETGCSSALIDFNK